MSINRIKGPKKPIGAVADSKSKAGKAVISTGVEKATSATFSEKINASKVSTTTSPAKPTPNTEVDTADAAKTKSPDIVATAAGRKSGSKAIASRVLAEYHSGKIDKSQVVPRLVDEVLSAGKIELPAAHMKSFRAQMELHVQNDPFFKSLLAKIGQTKSD